MKCIFIFAYYSYKDPVFQSAVLPYFINFNSEKYKFILLTWEQSAYRLSNSETQSIKKSLLEKNIIWYSATWHSGKFKLLKKAYDFLYGVFISLFLIYRHKAKMIYSEGFPGAVISCFLSIITKKPHIIHTYEPHADYMLESGVWSEKSWEYKALKKLELPIARQAHTLITATQVYKDILIKKGVSTKILVIPSCIDTEVYRYRHHCRQRIRRELNIEEEQIVISYLGKLGGMYMDEELFTFFKICYEYNPNQFYFFLFTNEPKVKIHEYLTKFQIPKERILVKFLQKEEVPDYLSAADFGFCGIRPIPSRRYSSPIKNGEYWACGLPILIPKGISDDYLYASKYKTGIVIENLSKGPLGVTVEKMNAWLKKNNKEEIVKRCRGFVEKDRSVKKYKEVYRNLFLKI